MWLFWEALLLPEVDCFALRRLSLANREYIRTAGLRSTVAWAMASLAEISVSERSGKDVGSPVKGGVAAHQGWKL